MEGGEVKEGPEPVLASEVIEKTNGRFGSLCFVVRRPG